MSEPGNRISRVSRIAQTRSFWHPSAIALACSMAVLTVARFWYFSDPYPPGLDGAQWLTYGRALTGGPGRSAESTYAPLIPILAHGLSLGLGPALGLRVLAASVLVLLAAAVWMLSVRVLGVVWGSLATALVLPCTALAEPFFYGGYPQQAALAFGILGLLALLSADREGSRRSQAQALAVASAAFLLASASHLLFGPLLLASGALVILASGIPSHDLHWFLLRAATLAPATAVSLCVALAFIGYGYDAPLAVSQRTLQEAWAYATRESPGLWAVIMMSGIAASIVVVIRHTTFVRTHPSPCRLPEAVIVGFALVAPSGILLIASGQPRLAPPLLLGGAMLFAYACRLAARAWDKALPVSLAVLSVATLWLAGTTTGLTREFANYYQVLDASWIAAARSIPSANGGAIAVAADRRGWPVGWWVEALQERPVFTGSNPQWLAFPGEQVRADAAVTLFAAQDVQVLQQRADELGVAYLVIRKWDWIGWDRWIDNSATSPAVIFDDSETLVLDVFPVSP